jgi:hypothetical protein
MTTAGRKMVWTGRVISGVVSALLLFSGIMKLTMRGPEMTEGLALVGLSESMVVPLAILEIACVVIYMIPQTAVLGAVLLTGYMGGAILTHWRVGDPFFMQILIGAAAWLGLYLREARLWSLLPLRTQRADGDTGATSESAAGEPARSRAATGGR